MPPSSHSRSRSRSSDRGDSPSSRSVAVAPRRRWTHAEVNEARTLHSQAQAYRWLHYRTAEYYRTWSLRVALPAYVLHLLTVGGAYSVAADGGGGSGGSTAVAWATTLVALVGLALKGVEDFFKFGKRQRDHKDAADGFSDLTRAVARELAKPDGEREPAAAFLVRVDDAYAKLKKRCDAIPPHILRTLDGVNLVDDAVARHLASRAGCGTGGGGGGGGGATSRPAGSPTMPTLPPPQSTASSTDAPLPALPGGRFAFAPPPPPLPAPAPAPAPAPTTVPASASAFTRAMQAVQAAHVGVVVSSTRRDDVATT